jgi:hypothetical protein
VCLFAALCIQGAATVRKLLPGVVSVFLVAESEAQLVARLVSRKTEPVDKMLTRVQTARWAGLLCRHGSAACEGGVCTLRWHTTTASSPAKGSFVQLCYALHGWGCA